MLQGGELHKTNGCVASAIYLCYLCVYVHMSVHIELSMHSSCSVVNVNYALCDLHMHDISLFFAMSFNMYWLDVAEKLQILQTTQITAGHMESNQTCVCTY